jgi:hypothetical protein
VVGPTAIEQGMQLVVLAQQVLPAEHARVYLVPDPHKYLVTWRC